MNIIATKIDTNQYSASTLLSNRSIQHAILAQIFIVALISMRYFPFEHRTHTARLIPDDLTS